MKLRIVRQLRSPEYDQLFAGDPTWVTAVLGGADESGRHMVRRRACTICCVALLLPLPPLLPAGDADLLV